MAAADGCMRIADIQRATGRSLKKLRAAGQERVALNELHRQDSAFNKYLRRCWHCQLLLVAAPTRREQAPSVSATSPGLLALEHGKEMLERMIERRRAIENENDTERLLLGALLRSHSAH